MQIPLTYNLRHLSVRRQATIMTALGIALTVAVLLAALALVEGLRAAFKVSGSPLNILVLRKGSTSELNSALSEQIYHEMLFKPGIAPTADGNHSMVSLELVTVITLPRPEDTNGQTVTLRGLLPVGIELRPVRLKEGRWFQSGRRELVVGEFVARRCPAAHVRGSLRIGHSDWNVVGVMDAGHSAVNSEIFADLNQVSNDFNRREQFSSVLVRAVDASALPELVDSFNNDQRLTVTAQPEKAYYERQNASGAPIRQLGVLVALIMSVGSCFAAMNTMYAAVARRTQEIGTLRVLGFSRGSILLSFLIESLLLAALGGVMGCLLVLPLNNVTTAIGNFTTMSETAFRFRVGPLVMLTGIGFALVMGGIGGFFPARNAARKEILTALREN
jgi:ABC-type antimicrobial peptide transport system permease subunit